MKKGDRVRCVDAKEKGIPLVEGQEYVLSCDPYIYRGGDIDRGGVKAVHVEGDGGIYMSTRFEVVA